MPNLIAGAGVRIALTFTNPISTSAPTDPASGDTLVDPSAITVYVKDGSGTLTTYTLAASQVVRDSVGLYHLTVDTTSKPGDWLLEVSTPSPVQCDQVGRFRVDPSPLHA